MNSKRVYKVLQIVVLTGMLSGIFYILHFLLGAIMWTEYDWTTRAVSDLTAVDAPNLPPLQFLLGCYHFCNIVFTICLVLLLWGRANRLATAGGIGLALVALVSYFGYGIAPFEGEAAGMTTANVLHIIVTAFIVVFSIAALFFLAIGFLKTPQRKGLGKFLLICAIVFTVAGGLAAPMLANHAPMSGLLQRINSGTLQVVGIVLSLYLFKVDLIKNEAQTD